mgnify:CR=1 FL=1
MKTIIKGIVVLTILSALVVGQLRSTLPSKTMPVNTQGLSHARNILILDQNRFSMNHSFGLSMMSSGNQSMTMGAYTNQMNYMVKDNLRLSTRFSLSSPMGGMNPRKKSEREGLAKHRLIAKESTISPTTAIINRSTTRYRLRKANRNEIESTLIRMAT